MKKKLTKSFICATLALVIAFSLCTPVFSSEPSSPKRHGYSTITESDVKYVYDLLLSEVNTTSVAQKITFAQSKSISLDELMRAVALFVSDYPECFWFRNNYSYVPAGNKVLSISPNYAFTGDALIRAKAELDSAVSEIISGLPSGSNYQKALYLHDALAQRVEYAQVGEHQTAYGALVSGKAVCAGYAAAYQLLLRAAGIKAWTVTGYAKREGSTQQIPHAWNLVWLDEDTCVYTDVTWNDDADEIYHYYFNLSKEEIHADHVTSTDIFTLPDCNHSNESYFDANPKNFSDNTPLDEVAALFEPAVNGKRSAVLYYTGNNFAAWIDSNYRALYDELGGGYGRYSYSYSVLGREVHVSFNGSFTSTAYSVSISAPEGMITYGESSQYVSRGNAMSEVTYTATQGYFFPKTYAVTTVNGISVRRNGSSSITVYGVPTRNVKITLPSPTQMPREATPNAQFTATGEDSGTLFNVEAGMRYSTDGTNWTDITSSDDLILSGLTAGNIYVIRVGDTEFTQNSEWQILTVTKNSCPQLSVTQPNQSCETGSINTDSSHEYSTDGENWSDCQGVLSNLMPGTYYVRVKASANALASEPQIITLNAQEVPSEPITDGEEDTAADLPDEDDKSLIDEDINDVLLRLNLGCGVSITGGSALLLVLISVVALMLTVTRKNKQKH